MLAGRAIALTVYIWVNISSYISVRRESPHYLITDIILLVGKSVRGLLYLSAFSIFLIIYPPLFVIYSLTVGIVNRQLWSNLFYILKLVRVGIWGATVSLFWFVRGLLYALWIFIMRFLNRRLRK